MWVKAKISKPTTVREKQERWLRKEVRRHRETPGWSLDKKPSGPETPFQAAAVRPASLRMLLSSIQLGAVDGYFHTFFFFPHCFSLWWPRGKVCWLSLSSSTTAKKHSWIWIPILGAQHPNVLLGEHRDRVVTPVTHQGCHCGLWTSYPWGLLPLWGRKEDISAQWLQIYPTYELSNSHLAPALFNLRSAPHALGLRMVIGALLSLECSVVLIIWNQSMMLATTSPPTPTDYLLKVFVCLLCAFIGMISLEF